MGVHIKSGRPQRNAVLPNEELVFRLKGIERIVCNPELGMPQRLASSYLWIAAVEGECRIIAEKGTDSLQAGGMRLFAPGRTFGIETPSIEGFSAYVLLFDVFREEDPYSGRLCALSGEVWPHGAASDVDLPIARLRTACETIDHYWRSPAAGERLKARAEFLGLVGDWSAASASPQRDSQTLLQQTKVFIDVHYREPLKLDELADMAGLSRNYYVGQFKKRYGKSVVEYMTDLRIRRAKRLMAGSGLKLREVAQQVGYSDEFYFSRRFKQETGVTPSAYVKSRSHRIAAYHLNVIGYLLALGIVPYAAPLHPKWSAYYHSLYADDIPVHLNDYRVGDAKESNLNQLERSRPERIVCGGSVSDEEKARLEQIAEVVYIRPEADWRTALLETAKALGRSSEAERWLAAYDEAAATIGHAIGRRRFGERTLMLRFIDGDFYSAASSSAAGVLRDDLGIRVIEWDRRHEKQVPISLEQLAEACADRILLLVCQEDGTLAAWERVRQSALWKGLPAAAEGRLHLIASDPWRECTPSAHKRVLKEAARIF